MFSKKSFLALFAGIIFGIGLSISQMTNPQKVKNFLDIGGQWDASLIFVMGGALIVSGFAWYLAKKRDKPILTKQFYLPDNQSIDRKLIIGAIAFGIGWGVSGLCPGPAIASIGFLSSELAYFLVAMLIGMAVGKKIKG
ncbi:DUF6691 family protein [Gayadomonas joobiniege]|uniref:DUF6691 family protein n=1 Tax=Gayadomonas joobiniege TaxID=1234606 RepID=UPI00037E16ED|nr:DUF6691 family protein [Gayadomonas joobiniege]